MTTSLNGWPVPPKQLKTFKVPGANRRLTLDKDAGRILVALAADYHKTVRKIDIGRVDDGGYANRDANGAPGKKSNHASGTAIDLNWSEEGAQGSAWGQKFFNRPDNIAKIKLLKKRYGSILVCTNENGDERIEFELWVDGPTPEIVSNTICENLERTFEILNT